VFGITEKNETRPEELTFAKGPTGTRQISNSKKESVLVFDFGLVLKHQTAYHSGLIFSAVTPLTSLQNNKLDKV
jgi:hypothetical protein